MPLAIDLAAARVRALSLTEILDSLHDRFRLLTGGSRRAVRRQQSLGASVDWSHALLTEPERILFRRLSAFMGGFDLDAAQGVCSGGALPRHQILDQLTLLVDKSLVVAQSTSGRTRYLLLETIRQYALEKLGESGEADAVRDSHRDYYISMGAGSTLRLPPALSIFLIRPRSRSTIFVPPSLGASSTRRSNVHYNSRARYIPCGSCAAVCWKAWRGSTQPA